MLTPLFLTATLLPGKGITETKTVTIPPAPEKLDILFSYDLTGSMSGIIGTAKSKTADLIAKLETLGSDINYGVVSYMDYPHYYTSFGYSAQYGWPPGDYAYSLEQPITNDTAAVLNKINGLVMGDGADSPQDYTRILYESYANPAVAWREGSRRILINFADDIPHDNDVNEGVPGETGVFSTGGDPGRDEIMFTPDDLDLQIVLAEMAVNKVTLIEAHARTTYLNYWTHWSSLTGGQAFVITSDTFVDDVYDALTSTLTTVTGLTLVATEGFEGWIESVTPESYTGSTTDPIVFQLVLRVPLSTPPGVYDFFISAVDAFGNVYGEQAVQIEVLQESDCTSTTVFQTIDVCVPVTVTASADVGPVQVTCCGNATVSFVPCPTECNTEITFYVRRRVCAEIPVDIDVEAVGGNACVNLVATSEEGCQDCPQNGGTTVII
jgi:hypothetical protein